MLDQLQNENYLELLWISMVQLYGSPSAIYNVPCYWL